MKVLTANSHIPANTPVIECRGKYMLASQLAGRARGGDYVLYHRIAPDLEVCVESKTYGNDSRFCRRADTVLSDCNAEVRHRSM
jgi:histone-lysine N-methyltransferase MLL5